MMMYQTGAQPDGESPRLIEVSLEVHFNQFDRSWLRLESDSWIERAG